MIVINKVEQVIYILEALQRLGYGSVVSKYIPALDKTLEEILGSKLIEKKKEKK